jgi:VWFA-related protein
MRENWVAGATLIAGFSPENSPAITRIAVMRQDVKKLIRGLVSATALAGAFVCLVSDRVGVAAQQPTFRSGVDVIAVDVQVVDPSGNPISALAPGDFQVSISGKSRRVVSADFIRTTHLDGKPFDDSVAPAAVASNQWPDRDPRAGRIYILAFDIGSLTLTDSRSMVSSASKFIDRLLPNDLVGLYTFPIGSRIEPTTDHAAVRNKVQTVVGTPQGFNSRFNLSPSEVIDISAEASKQRAVSVGRPTALSPAVFAEDTDVLRSVQLRECGGDMRCVDEIITEAQSIAFYLEGRAMEGLNGIRALVSFLADYPGRKTVVMFSSGIPAADRPGARPDLGDLPKLLGQDAAATNTSIYTIHVDTGQIRAMSPESRKPMGTPATRTRDHNVGGRVLEEFSGASGGALLRVVTGAGEFALERVLRETSSHYLLGVLPDEGDRDGKVRQLRVKVARNGATVRSRLWVVIPKPTELASGR